MAATGELTGLAARGPASIREGVPGNPALTAGGAVLPEPQGVGFGFCLQNRRLAGQGEWSHNLHRMGHKKIIKISEVEKWPVAGYLQLATKLDPNNQGVPLGLSKTRVRRVMVGCEGVSRRGPEGDGVRAPIGAPE